MRVGVQQPPRGSVGVKRGGVRVVGGCGGSRGGLGCGGGPHVERVGAIVVRSLELGSSEQWRPISNYWFTADS